MSRNGNCWIIKIITKLKLSKNSSYRKFQIFKRFIIKCLTKVCITKFFFSCSCGLSNFVKTRGSLCILTFAWTPRTTGLNDYILVCDATRDTSGKIADETCIAQPLGYILCAQVICCSKVATVRNENWQYSQRGTTLRISFSMIHQSQPGFLFLF